MSYENAIACFNENIALLRTPSTDAAAWNLNQGLAALAEATRDDSRQITNLLNHIYARLPQTR